METNQQRIVAAFFLRVLLGVIFMMQGWGKIMTFGMDKLYQNGFASFEETFLPVFIIKFTLYFTTYVELIGGFLLVIGLFRKYAYYAFVLVLLIVSFGHGLQSPIWDLQHVIFRTILVGACLIIPTEWDQLQVDRFFRKK